MVWAFIEIFLQHKNTPCGVFCKYYYNLIQYDMRQSKRKKPGIN